jgi:hypothetical protein
LGWLQFLAPAHVWFIDRKTAANGQSTVAPVAFIATQKSLKTKPESLQGNPDHLRLMKQATVHIHFVMCPAGNGRRNPWLAGKAVCHGSANRAKSAL